MFWITRPFLLFLKFIRPLYLFSKRHFPNFWGKIRADLQDPYLSGMIRQFNRVHHWLYSEAFKKVHVDPSEIEHLKNLASQGTLVYVMKKQGQLEYSFFNHLFIKEGIPLARFANGGRTLLWRPFPKMFTALMGKLDLFYSKGLLADPIQSDYLENCVASGGSVLLNLRVSRELIFGADCDAIEFIAPLLEAAAKSEKPVFLITQQYLYDRHPEKAGKSIVDWLFGEKSNPGMFRKFVMFLMSYNKKARVKFGVALNLSEFVRENQNSDRHEQSLKLQTALLDRLMIERKSITGPQLMSPDKMLEKMLRSPLFKEDIEALAHESNFSVSELENKASRYFNEIASTINYNYIDLYDRMIDWMVNNIFDGLDLDTEGLNRVKAKAGKHPIVLVPSHKSHIDYLLLSYVFYNHDLTMPHICAGINLNFWPAGRFLRRGGAFFIRRSLEGNKLYKLVLDHYIKTLVREGYTTEFFIEGTRSRTGKLLKPKMGILSMIMDAYMRGATPDMYFVPISVHYEKILEEKSYVDEIKGASKEKENMFSLLKIHKKFGRKYGKVHIRFAEPLSIKEFFDAKNITPKSRTIHECRKEVEEFAYTLTYNINKVAVVTSTSLVAASLLTYPKKGIPEPEILNRVRLLQKYIEFKGATLSSIIQQLGDKAYEEALHKLSTERLTQPHQDFWEKFYTVDESKRSLLDYHKNNSLHFFVSLVAFSKILDVSEKQSLFMDEVIKRYEIIKTLLRHDFTFSFRQHLEEHVLKVIEFYSREKVIAYDPEKKVVSFSGCRRNPIFRTYASLLDNFFESAFIVLMFIKFVPFEKNDPKKLIPLVMEKGRLFYFKGELKFPEALSQFNIRHALSVFEDLGLIVRENGLLSRRFDLDIIHEWEVLLRALLGMPSTQNLISELADTSLIALEERH